jgi:hypothetical protein
MVWDLGLAISIQSSVVRAAGARAMPENDALLPQRTMLDIWASVRLYEKHTLAEQRGIRGACRRITHEISHQVP